MILYTNDKHRNVYINEGQISLLKENFNDEGFRMSYATQIGSDGRSRLDQNNPMTITFDQNTNGYADTNIFKDGTKEFNIRKKLLPNSGLESINLYRIRNMNVNKALKHGKNIKGNEINVGNESASNSMEYFKKRSAYYISRILSSMGVYPDVFTSPQSSSQFNIEMLNLLSKYYPNGDIVMMPQAFKKDPRNVFIDYNRANEIGMSNDEIAALQSKIGYLKQDEDTRDYRKNKVELSKVASKYWDEMLAWKRASEQVTKIGRRGRPTRELVNKKYEYEKMAKEAFKKWREVSQAIDAYDELIKLNRRRGVDPTIDKDGNIKSMQIKSMDDKQRRVLNGLFRFNDALYPSKKYSKDDVEYTYSQAMRFKDKIVVVFDDNLSSGATLDMFCVSLKKMGVKMIIPITLGIIPLTAYSKSERKEFRDNQFS